MEKAEFEKRFLTLVNQTTTEITAANVAYHLEIPIDETQEHLLGLELNGILRQATKKDGSTYYEMPGRLAPGTPRAIAEQSSVSAGSQAQAPGVHNPADLPSAPIYSTPNSAPAAGRSVNGLVLNVLFPGVGSLVAGSMLGLAILGLLIAGIVFLFVLPGFTRLLGIPMIVASWIWSIVAGVMLLNKKERPASR